MTTPLTMQQEERHVTNTMQNYDVYLSQCQLNSSIGSQSPDHTFTFKSSSDLKKLEQETRVWIFKNIETILKSFPPESQSCPTSVRGKSQQDYSIYVGCGGNAYLHWKLAKFFEAEGDIDKAEFHKKSAVVAVEVALSLLPSYIHNGEEIAFYIGSAGKLVYLVYWL